MSAPTLQVDDEGTEEELETFPLLEEGKPCQLVAAAWLPSRAQAHGMMLLATVIYALWNCVIKTIGESKASLLAYAFFRLVGSTILFVGLQCILAPWQCLITEWRTNLRQYAMMGSIIFCGQLCLLAGTNLTSATTTAIFQSAEPSMAAIIGFISGMEDPRTMPRRLLSALLAGFGVAVITFFHEGNLDSPMRGAPEHGVNENNFDHIIGCGLLLAQSCGVIFYYLLQTKLLAAESSTRTALVVTSCAWGSAIPIALMLVATNILILPVDAKLTSFHEMSLVFTERPTHGLPPAVGLLYAILFASLAGYLLWGTANKCLEASELLIYPAVQFPVTGAMSALLLGEHMKPTVAIGAMLICGALFLRSPTFCPLPFLREKEACAKL